MLASYSKSLVRFEIDQLPFYVDEHLTQLIITLMLLQLQFQLAKD